MLRRRHILAASLALLAAAPLRAQPPTTLPAAPRVGDVLSVDDLLYAIASTCHVVVVHAKPIEGTVTLTEPLPTTSDAAPAALSRLLAPLGYNALRGKSRAGAPPVVRLLTGEESRKLLLEQGPVTTGSDPAVIDLSDRARLITHVLPMTRGDLATAARNLASQDKEIQIAVIGDTSDAPGSIQCIITGPASRVRAAVETIIAVDRPSPTPLIRTRRMKFMSAEPAADALLRNFGQGPPDQALKAIGDKGSNTVVLSGPDLVVLEALVLLDQLDREAPKPRFEVPKEYNRPSLPMLQPPPPPPAPAPAPAAGPK